MTEKMKKITAVGLCAAFSLAAYLYLCLILTPKDVSDSGGTLYYNGMGFLAEPENSLDIVTYGNSDVYSGFSPAVLQERFGYNSYASGRARQNMGSVVDLLKKTLKTQKPKVVILETDCFFEEKDRKLDSSSLLVAPFLYHSRWKEIKVRDFYKRPSLTNTVDENKGYIDSDLAFQTTVSADYMGDPNAAPEVITERNLRYIEEFVSICRKNDIQVLLAELPSPYSWTYAQHNAVAALAEKMELPFLDLNVQPEHYGLNLQTDFRDNGNHLNRSGAEKATAYIGSYVQEHYGDLFDETQTV